MKKLFALLFLTASITAFCQPSSTDRLIEVTGESEIKIDPNIVVLSLEIREMKKEGKIIKLEEIEPQLLKALQTAGIPADNLKVSASSGKQAELKKRKPDLLISKRYTLKLPDPDLLNTLLLELGETNIYSVNVSETSHTDLEKFKNEARIKAISNAKEKAIQLVTAAGAKLGPVIQIKEIESNELMPLQGRASSMQMRGNPGAGTNVQEKQPTTINMEQIRLIYKVVVKFAIE
jgi:uncharacterized protein YggE